MPVCSDFCNLVSEAHLHRYGAECDFRYNTRLALGYDDAGRAALAIKAIAGKRLTYRKPYGTPGQPAA